MKTQPQASAGLSHAAAPIDDIPVVVLTTPDTDRGCIDRLWTVFAEPGFLEGPDSPKLAWLKFGLGTADGGDAPDSKRARAFGGLASMVAGRPIAMGEHGSHGGLSSGAAAAGVHA